MKVRSLITIEDLTSGEVRDLIIEAEKLKKDPNYQKDVLSEKTVGLLFQKPSLRTRVSFEVGIIQLGGSTMFLSPDEIQLGVREPVKDIARVLSRYLDAIVARTFAHNVVKELAEHADVPVINGLSDYLHPCQALSDFFTIYEKKKEFSGVKLGYVGDGNNVLHSLILAAAKTGLHLCAATPSGYRPDEQIVKKAERIVREEKTGAQIVVTTDPREAVEEADFVYTDVWISMGQKSEREKKLAAFRDFQLNETLLSFARGDALVMHCLPAHRGEEITGEVIDGKSSIVIDQAENRMHMQKAVLCMLLGSSSC